MKKIILFIQFIKDIYLMLEKQLKKYLMNF